MDELQSLMNEFPVGSTVRLGDIELFVMGYYQSDKLILADRDPKLDYNDALKSCWSYESHIFRVKH